MRTYFYSGNLYKNNLKHFFNGIVYGKEKSTIDVFEEIISFLKNEHSVDKKDIHIKSFNKL